MMHANPEGDDTRSLKRRTRHRIEAAVLAGMIRTIGAAPRGLAVALGERLGSFAFRVVGLRRSVVIENIRAALPDVTAVEASQIAEQSYRTFGRSVMEITRFHNMTRRDLLEQVTVEGTKHLDEVIRAGRGAVLISAHLGNWELLGAVVANCGYPIHVTDTRHTNPHTHALLTTLRARQGMKVISPDEPVSHLLKILADNQFVAYLPDQNARAAGVFVDYFGQPAWTLRAPAVLAIRRECPVVPAFMTRNENGKHRAIFCEPVWSDQSRSGDEAVMELTRRYTAIIEDVVRKNPGLYFWMHRRWKTQPAS